MSKLRLLVIAPILFAAVGCSTMGTSTGVGREFVIENTWTRATTKDEFLGYRRMNRMTPLVLDDTVVQGNSIDGLIAYRRSNGRELWRLNLENGVEGGAQASGGKLYVGSSNGDFYCIDLKDGKILWTFQVRAETLAQPTVDSGIVYFQSGADVVYALDAETGKQLWLYNRQVTGNLSIRATTRPVVAGEFVLAGFSDGYLVAIRKRDGNLAWERKLGRATRFLDVDATPVVDGPDVFVASYDAALYSLSVESGAVNWTVESGAYVPVTLGSGAASDRLYYSTANGKILVLDRKSGKQLRSIDVKHGIATQVSLYKNSIVYGESEGDLVVADPETGATLARFSPGAGVLARPAVIEQSGEAFMISNGANLWSLKLGYRSHAERLPWQKKM